MGFPTGRIGMQVPSARDERKETDELELLDRYWRAANYLSVGQIYLLDNPLLKQPLRRVGGPRRG
jgi:xylulose-5-phosphate/fructose-6-phosphate phosphoketolase